MPFFSVVIPVFNREKLIKDTLQSVFNQTFKDYETIVVDDGSTDNTLEVLSQFSGSISVLKQKNRGAGLARNKGISQATGEYVAFLDSDDLWFPWTLETYKQVINRTQAPFISGTAFDFSQPSELNAIRPSNLKFNLFSDYLETHDRPVWILPSAATVQAQLLREKGGFTEQRVIEDSDLWLKLGTAEGFVNIQRPYVAAYRRHENSVISNVQKTWEGMVYLIDQENHANYPGGKLRTKERRGILTRHIRPVSLASLQRGRIRDAWQLYASTFRWHIQLKRIKYLSAFWIILAVSLLRKSRRINPGKAR